MTIDPLTYQKDLGDGLLLRFATQRDIDEVAVFDSHIHADPPDTVDAGVDLMVRDLMDGRHPTTSYKDFLVVEDTQAHKIISSIMLISQKWKYEDIPFGVGRIELVGTDPAYRKRGLIREQFNVVHELSRQKGESVQIITGIPNYYRQFGYEMALDLEGGRSGFVEQVPKLPEGIEEPFLIRPAEEKDIPFLIELSRAGGKRNEITCVYDERQWKYEISRKREGDLERMAYSIIEARDGKPVGAFNHVTQLWGGYLISMFFEVKPGVSWLPIFPVVLRRMIQNGNEIGAKTNKKLIAYGIWLGTEHPAYHILPELLPRFKKPYAYYLRVADIPKFLRSIAPVLEDRLSHSIASGTTGELRISFYPKGVKLVFNEGILKSVDEWEEVPGVSDSMAGFPGLTFLQLLFGYRSLEELRKAFPDCIVNRKDNTQVLLEILFPAKPSWVTAIC
jgi:hypothetical protein